MGHILGTIWLKWLNDSTVLFGIRDLIKINLLSSKLPLNVEIPSVGTSELPFFLPLFFSLSVSLPPPSWPLCLSMSLYWVSIICVVISNKTLVWTRTCSNPVREFIFNFIIPEGLSLIQQDHNIITNTYWALFIYQTLFLFRKNCFSYEECIKDSGERIIEMITHFGPTKEGLLVFIFSKDKIYFNLFFSF